MPRIRRNRYSTLGGGKSLAVEPVWVGQSVVQTEISLVEPARLRQNRSRNHASTSMRIPPLVVVWFSFVALAAPANAGSPNIVISQVYGGGGNAGAEYRNDFIELFNRGTEAVDLTGWSVQYAAATGSIWSKTDLAGVLGPGQYYLVQEAQGSGGTLPLPTPDATGVIAMSAASGKVAVVNSKTALLGAAPDPSTYVDLIGFGAASYFEGAAAAPGMNNTIANVRADGGCQDTDQNGNDFATGAPAPRNTSSPIHLCAQTPTLDIVLMTIALDSSGDLRVDGAVSVTATLTLEFSTDLTGWMPEPGIAPMVAVAGDFTFRSPVSNDARYYRVSAVATP